MHPAFRQALAAMVIGLVAAAGFWIFFRVQAVPIPSPGSVGRGALATIDYNDAVQDVASHLFDTAADLRQLALVLAGALWAVLLARGDVFHIRVKDQPELLMLAGAHVLIGATLWCNWRYERVLESYLAAGAFPPPGAASGTVLVLNLLSPSVEALLTLQAGLLVFSTAATAATLFSAAQLKPDAPTPAATA